MTHLLKAREVQRIYGISRTSLHRRVNAEQIPAPIKINGVNYWPSNVIDEHIRSVIRAAS